MKKKFILLLAIIMTASLSFIQAQTYKANPEKTAIIWHGEKVGGDHTGNIYLKSAEIEMSYEKPVSGTVVIDMSSIDNTDIQNDGMRKRLVDHLKSDDFFGVEKFPEAVFEITGSERKNGGSIEIKGNITIKGITEPIEFVSNLSENEEDDLIFTGHIEIDRTLFDVRFGSTKFFDNIADRAIDDMFTLDYELYLEKE